MRVVVNPNRLEIRNPRAEARKKSEGRRPNDLRLGGRRLISDFGFRASEFGPRPSSSSGVALVITLIMLAVITFMAIAFLVLSRGERSSVTTQTDMAIAQNPTNAHIERI